MPDERRRDLNFYRFRSEWRLRAPRDAVLEALEDTARYSAWWPEIREVVARGPAAQQMTARSLLPYDLVFVTTQSRRDPEEGILEASMTGDLAGFSRWTINGGSDASVAVFEEEVTAMKPLLRRLALVARPAFVANHRLMMRHGRAGLQTYLAGYVAGTRRDGP